jgi:hypothetical protein
VRYDFSHSDILWYPKTSNLEIREVKIILFSKKFPKFLFAEIWIMILLSGNNIYSLFIKGLSLRISFCQATGSGINSMIVPLSAIWLIILRALWDLSRSSSSEFYRIRKFNLLARAMIISVSSESDISRIMVRIYFPILDTTQL